MNPQIEALLRQKIQQFNIMMGAQQPQGQQPGMAEGGMPTGIIPGPVTPGGGDNTLTPTQTGEYIIPVDAVMGLGVRMGATSHGDALAIGKHVLDKEVMGLKKEMGNNTPPRNAGINPGMAEGGMLTPVSDWIDRNIVQPVTSLVSPKPGISTPASQPTTQPTPLQPPQMGTGYLSDSAAKAQEHNRAVQAVANDSGYAEGGSIEDPLNPPAVPLAPTMGIPMAPTTVPAYSPVKDVPLSSINLSENKPREIAIRQAVSGQGYTNLIPPSAQPNLQPTQGIPTAGMGIGSNKVTMTPTTEKLAIDKEGYYKELPNVQPGTGILSVGGKTYDITGVGPSQQMGVGGTSDWKDTGRVDAQGRTVWSSNKTQQEAVKDENNQLVPLASGVSVKRAGVGAETAYKDAKMVAAADLAKKGITDPTEIAREAKRQIMEDKITEAKARGLGFQASRATKAYDTELDKVRTISLSDSINNPERYVDPSDAHYAAYKKNVDYRRANANFVNTIDNYASLVERITNKYNLNKDPKWMNYSIQDLLKRQGLGKGDVALDYQLIAGISADIGKIETGSLGIAGASVEALKTFKTSPNMPAGELIKWINGSRNAGRARLEAIDKETQDIKNEMLPAGYKELSKAYTAPENPTGPPEETPIGLKTPPATSVPPNAISFLKANPTPEMKQQFDTKYGAGAAEKALGGK